MYNPNVFIEEIGMISALLIENKIKVYKMNYYGFKIEGEKVILDDDMNFVRIVKPSVNLFLDKEEETKYISVPLTYNLKEFKIIYKQLSESIKKYKKED